MSAEDRAGAASDRDDAASDRAGAAIDRAGAAIDRDHISQLLHQVRNLCVALIVLMVLLGGLLASSRGISQSNHQGINRVDNAFRTFNAGNQKYLDNHARTQRLACAQIRALNAAPPVSPITHKSDCDGR